jgi:dTDP-glucose 4,6-dehydratase
MSVWHVPRSALVTGGCGFIGSALVRRLCAVGTKVTVLDLHTYAAQPEAIADVRGAPGFEEIVGDVGDASVCDRALAQRPEVVFHLAAQTHVDRSIDGPAPFLTTNVNGTAMLLEAIRRIPAGEAPFLVHMSTDEVFGDAAPGATFSETSPYAPRSPYAASKAAADHLVDAWRTTFGVKSAILHSGNAFGPWQHPEKFIPTLISNALAGRPLPIYGDGLQERSWVHVEDLVDALILCFGASRNGGRFLIGPDVPTSNMAIASMVCDVLDQVAPREDGAAHASAFASVADRPGHDRRYAIDARHAHANLGWRQERPLEHSLPTVVSWYVDRVRAGKLQPQARLGLAGAQILQGDRG